MISMENAVETCGIPLGLQHVLAMFVGNLTPLLIICGACGNQWKRGSSPIFRSVFTERDVCSGVVTLVQLYAIGPIGGKVPIIMGTSSGFIGVFKSVADTMGGGLATYGAIMGASILGGLFESVLGFFIKPLRKFFPGSCNGNGCIVHRTVPDLRRDQFFRRRKRREGLWLYGEPSPGDLCPCGDPYCETLDQRNGKQLRNSHRNHCGIYCGICYEPGSSDNGNHGRRSRVHESMGPELGQSRPEQAGSAFRNFLPVKPVFDARAIAPILIMFIVTAVETVGDISGVIEGGMNREATDKELSGGVICDGIGSSSRHCSEFFQTPPSARTSDWLR